MGERRAARGAGDRGGARRPHRVRAEALRAHLPALDGEHPRLVHQPPDLVGPPHPRLVLRRRGLRRDHRRGRGSGRLPLLRRRAAAGRGHPRHLVLVRAVAALDAGLAGRGRRGSAALLPDAGDGDRLRHHLLLGRAHDHALALQHARLRGRRHPLRDGLPAWPGARARRAQDVQVLRQRRRPARRDRAVRARTRCATR